MSGFEPLPPSSTHFSEALRPPRAHAVLAHSNRARVMLKAIYVRPLGRCRNALACTGAESVAEGTQPRARSQQQRAFVSAL